MPYIEFVGPPGCGKTTIARQMLCLDPALAPGRRSLRGPGTASGVTGLGLPPEGAGMWLRLAFGLPKDLLMSLRFWRDAGKLDGATKLLFLLAKSRALAASPRRWVVDQGLQQHVLNALARERLGARAAREWKSLCRKPPWGPERLIEPTAEPQELLRRVRASKKHLSQCQTRTPEEYVGAYLRCAALLRD